MKQIDLKSPPSIPFKRSVRQVFGKNINPIVPQAVLLFQTLETIIPPELYHKLSNSYANPVLIVINKITMI